MRKFLRPILVLLAIIFLIEAWLWDRLEPLVARVVNVIPWGRLKIVVARWVETLPPAGTLVVFVVPVALLIPIKLIELWFFVNGAWVEGVSALVISKLLFLGTTAFVFDVTRDKLLQLDWFRVMYDYIMWLRTCAHELVDPIKYRISARMRVISPSRAPRALRLLRRFRRRMQSERVEYAVRTDAPRAARTGQSP